MQYCSPLAGENIVMPTSPVSTDVGIYEAMEDLDDKDLQLRYLYDNVPHHQDQIKSPRKLRNGAPWSNILSLPSNLPENSQSRLPMIVKYSLDDQESQEISQVKRGKRRITDEFISPPASPRVLNVGYGTPFKLSSQFFTRPGGVPLPPTETVSQRNVLVGLGLPHTPAFKNIPNTREALQASKSATQIRSQASNPFEGRPLPPHMAEDTRESREDLGQATSTLINQQNTNFIDNQRQRPTETKSDGGSSHHRSSNGNQRGGNRGNPAGGDPDGSDDDDDGDEYPRRNNRNNRGSSNNGLPSYPTNHGGGGGNPGGGGGGNGPSNNEPHSNAQPQGNVPYGNLVATIRNELKQDQLPVWDGNKDTAIEYFWKIQQLAALEGDIPVALGYWLWKSLKENSRIWMWFTTLPFTEQSKMRTHYLHYLKGIKDNYLGHTWHISMNRKYESQSFRQEGFERESPPAFIVCRIMYTRMLVASDDGGPTEVYLVMQKAPISWGPILNLETIRSTSLLYSRATNHELALVHAAKYESSNVLTADNLLYTLRKLGISTDRNCPYGRSAKLVSNKDPVRESAGDDVIHEAFLGQLSREECTQEITSDPEVMKEAFQVLKKRQRPPPKGGYPYSKNDHVTTKMGRLPPSPCKVCGSNNHWDKECPNWSFYEAKQLKAAYRIETNEDEDLENYYSSVYSVLVMERLTTEDKQGSESSDFHEAVLNEGNDHLPRERKSGDNSSRKPQTVFIEEEEDESWSDY